MAYVRTPSLAYRDGVATPDYTIRDESYTLRARSVRGGSLSPVSPSDKLASCQHATSVPKRKAAEQDSKA